ncbi:MAG: ribonuclease R [Planctomycetaceae bacterium]|nr:ribonuclease R [Planctomycetaceae bacterium]MBP62334.1 ribonuclease R [Planctomycetaceae bacterium]
MDQQTLEQRLLQYVGRANYKPVKPRVIARKLHLSDKQHRELKQAIKRLVRRGELRYGSNHLVHHGQGGSHNRVAGVFRKTKSGFGFVRPQGGAKDGSGDIYVLERKTKDAANGDLVLTRLNKSRGPMGKLRGEIVEVIERKTHRFVGTYDTRDGTGLVRIDGTVFGSPILAGDAGTKNARPGDKVVVEMVRFPSHIRNGECVVTEVLGQRGAPGVDTLSIIREFNLPKEFPQSVLDDARRQAELFDESIPDDRVDLTDRVVITIDPQDARDFDDAISLEQIHKRHWRLGVHIADVSHFVRPRSALDREARERATSVYLPDRVIPMLPEIISNNLASLQPNCVRYTKTVFIEFTPEGTRVGTEPCSAAIRSSHRFNYEEVDDFLQRPSKWKRKLPPEIFQLLGHMCELAKVLRARRYQRGALELSIPETKIDLDQKGRVCGAHLLEHTESHQMIEEFMLAANEAVAEFFQDRDWLFLRRVHESPDPKKMKGLTDFVRELGIDSRSLKSRFELQRVLEHLRGLPQERAVNYAVLRSMQKAIYGPQQEGHYALASECYCHFTSPIRRYPDLTVHRLLDAVFRKKRPSQDFGRMLMEGEHCSEREQRAEEAERELTKLKLLNYFSQRIGNEMEAVVTGVEEFGIFAQGTELPAEGLIHVNSLQDDHYRFDRTTRSLVGYGANNSFGLGDIVTVQIAQVDVDARQLDLLLVKPKRAGKGKKTVKRQAKKSPNSRKKAAKGTGQQQTQQKTSTRKGKGQRTRRSRGKVTAKQKKR